MKSSSLSSITCISHLYIVVKKKGSAFFSGHEGQEMFNHYHNRGRNVTNEVNRRRPLENITTTSLMIGYASKFIKSDRYVLKAFGYVIKWELGWVGLFK